MAANRYLKYWRGKQAIRQRLFIYMKKGKTATVYMAAMIEMKDYQLVKKKQGVKSIPPFSSPVLLFKEFVVCSLWFVRMDHFVIV